MTTIDNTPDTFDASLAELYALADRLLDELEASGRPIPAPDERRGIDEILDHIWTAYFNTNLTTLRCDNAWKLFPGVDLLAAWRAEVA